MKDGGMRGAVIGIRILRQQPDNAKALLSIRREAAGLHMQLPIQTPENASTTPL